MTTTSPATRPTTITFRRPAELPNHNDMPFPLLDLPPEIREKIYLYTLISPDPIPLTADSLPLQHPSPPHTPKPNPPLNNRLHPLFPHALLLTCHQTYHEVRPLYFTHNTFSLLLMRDPAPLLYFLSPSFRDNRRRIKALKLVISRWGKHDFFLNELAPVLEDMILNGYLRDLEVWARRLHLFVTGRDNGIFASAARPVERLVGILMDPYLERVVVKTPVENGPRPGTYYPSIWPDEDITRIITGRGEESQRAF